MTEHRQEQLTAAVSQVMERAYGRGDPEEMERMLLTIEVDPDVMREVATDEVRKAMEVVVEEGADLGTMMVAHGVNMFLAGANYERLRRESDV